MGVDILYYKLHLLLPYLIKLFIINKKLWEQIKVKYIHKNTNSQLLRIYTIPLDTGRGLYRASFW